MEGDLTALHLASDDLQNSSNYFTGCGSQADDLLILARWACVNLWSLVKVCAECLRNPNRASPLKDLHFYRHLKCKMIKNGRKIKLKS